MTVPAPTALPQQFGPYRIVRPLGKGGMGTVYLARDTRLDRDVALKVCHLADARPQALERFRREAKAAASLRHPNLCPVYEYDERSGIAYLTMAFIEGPTLDRWLSKTALTPRLAARLIAKLAAAMQEAHDNGVIHRDLKPSNIAFDKRGEPVVLDFGLAKQFTQGSTHHTRLGAVLGTPTYMSPEQIEGDPAKIGPVCDVYSLGVILYETLAGTAPFEGPPTTVMAQVLRVAPQPPSRRNPVVDPHLEAICLKAMAKKPGERYPSMAAFGSALSDYASLSGAEADRPLKQAGQPGSGAGVKTLPPPLPPTVPNTPAPLVQAPRRRRRARSPHTPYIVAGLVGFLVLVTVLGFVIKALLSSSSPTTAAKDEAKKDDGRKDGSRKDDVKKDDGKKTVEPPKPDANWLELAKKRQPFTNPSGVSFVYVPPRTFRQGSPQEEAGREATETAHSVTLTRGYYLGTTLVTQRQWKAVMGEANNPSKFRGDDLPVDSVTWNDAQDFCKRLSMQDGVTYRLPTEAEWENACRAGTTTAFWVGDALTTNQANFDGNYPYPATAPRGETRESTTPVTNFPANPWGLYDMHGNLYQWCSDYFADYPLDMVEDPMGPPAAPFGVETRVLRGGSWRSDARYCRAAYRLGCAADRTDPLTGLRVAVTPP